MKLGLRAEHLLIMRVLPRESNYQRNHAPYSIVPYKTRSNAQKLGEIFNILIAVINVMFSY